MTTQAITSHPSAPNPAFVISLRNDPDGKGKPGHGLGEPSYINKLKINEGSEDDPFTYSLDDRVAKATWISKLCETAGDGPILIFVHGFFNLAPKVITRYMAVNSGLIGAKPSDNYENITVVCFDWPSNQTLNKPYPNDQDNAVKSAPYFISSCLELMKKGGINMNNVHTLGHSMGCYVLQNAFNALVNAYPIGQVMLAEADVLDSTFATEKESGDWSGLCCFMPHLTHLTVYWSGCDKALEGAVGNGTFSLPCAVNDTNENNEIPIRTTLLFRLGHNGLSSETLASNYRTKMSNVGYAAYYVTKYGESSKPSDSHVWPILGTTDNPQWSGDAMFMQDVWDVIMGTNEYRSRIPSATNNWTFVHSVNVDDN